MSEFRFACKNAHVLREFSILSDNFEETLVRRMFKVSSFVHSPCGAVLAWEQTCPSVHIIAKSYNGCIKNDCPQPKQADEINSNHGPVSHS